MILAAGSGAFGTFLGSPFFLVKIRMQSYSPIIKGVGEQYKYNSTWDAFKSVYKQTGLKGFFRGSGNNNKLGEKS